MSDYTIETIELTETSRLRVEVDQDTTNPRKDWDMLTGFVKIEGRGDSRLADVEPVHDAPIDIRHAYHEFFGKPALYTDILWRQHARSQELVVRWARAFHGLHVEYDDEHGGYWFVDRASWAAGWDAPADGFTLERQAEIISSERETYRQWAEGEVYGVVLERRVTYVRVIDSDSDTLPTDVDWNETRDEWDEVESIWGCYLDDSYTAQVVADEYFPLTSEERDALGLPERQEAPRGASAGVSGEW